MPQIPPQNSPPHRILTIEQLLNQEDQRTPAELDFFTVTGLAIQVLDYFRLNYRQMSTIVRRNAISDLRITLSHMFEAHHNGV